MLNPDGVIVGNSRCCLLGQDLNRQYCTVLREAFPQIYQTKVLLRRLAEENGVFMYCDIHGHSRRNNVFIYGCENRRIPEKRLTEQIFPLMMHKNAADKVGHLSTPNYATINHEMDSIYIFLYLNDFLVFVSKLQIQNSKK